MNLRASSDRWLATFRITSEWMEGQRSWTEADHALADQMNMEASSKSLGLSE